VDRIGDTFRWKGENISTEQVASVVMGVPFVEFCAVYGVSVERHEGRVGMAAIQVQEGEKFDGRAFFERMEEGLMPAGRPRFVRVVRHLEMTRTLKVIKHRLQEEGVDPAGFQDPLYWYNEARRTYTRVNKTNLEKALEAL
jgi:acyl-CoA synthetase (AMP-forming)/AMP-acid ligase II